MGEATYEGSCHCAAIGFDYHSRTAPDEWAVRACQCRFCRAHDALSTSHRDSRISFKVAVPDQLQRYRFGLMTADFLLCRNCGVYIGAVIETGKGRFGIINTHALRPQPESIADAGAISYDGEVTDGRVKRREERWSPVIAVPW